MTEYERLQAKKKRKRRVFVWGSIVLIVLIALLLAG